MSSDSGSDDEREIVTLLENHKTEEEERNKEDSEEKDQEEGEEEKVKGERDIGNHLSETLSNKLVDEIILQKLYHNYITRQGGNLKPSTLKKSVSCLDYC